jgi:hypothetical protein
MNGWPYVACTRTCTVHPNSKDSLPTGSSGPSYPEPTGRTDYECKKCERQARECHENHQRMHSIVSSISMGYTCQSFDETCARICR